MLAFAPCSTILAIGSFSANLVLIVDLQTGREIGRIQTLGNVRSLGFLSSEELLVVHSGVCLLYNLRNRELAPVWQEDNSTAAYPTLACHVLASPDGQVVALGTNYGGMLLYDITAHQVRHSLETSLAVAPQPVAFSTDGRYVVFQLSAEERGGKVLMVFDTKTGRRLRTYEVKYAQALACQGEKIGVIDYDRQATYLYEFAGDEDPVAEFPVGCGAGLRFVEGDQTLELLGQDGSLHRLHQGKSQLIRPASTPDLWEELTQFLPSPDWQFLAGYIYLENKVVIWRPDRARPIIA